MRTPLAASVVLALVAGLILPLPSFGAGSTAKPKAKAGSTKISIVTSVNVEGKSITINNGATTKFKSGNQSHDEQTFKVDNFTSITVNGLKAGLSDIKTGMKVDITIGMNHDTAGSIVAYGTPPALATPSPAAGAAKGKGKGAAKNAKNTKPAPQLGQAIEEDKIVEVSGDTVTVGQAGAKQMKAFKILKDTQITVNGAKAQASELHAGQKVVFHVGMDPHTLASIEAHN